MIDEKQFIKTDEDGVVKIDTDKVEKLIVTEQEKEKEYKSFSEEVKKVILTLMEKYNSSMIKSSKYTISKVQPKDKVEFDENKFLLENSPEILADFVDVIEEKVFDEEKFKTENPELYEKYVNTNYISSVNVKKLEKNMPTLYDKYSKTIKSEKQVTIRIAENKK